MLSRHKELFAKELLDFDPSSSNKKDDTPKKVVFVCEGQEEKGKDKVKNGVVSGGATRGNPTHSKFKVKMNPSYVLCRAKDGDIYVKFGGPCFL